MVIGRLGRYELTLSFRIAPNRRRLLRVSVRPTSRLAFFERWGCLCQFAHGALEFDARICP